MDAAQAKKVVYYVNGVASTVWRRLASSKTFWVAVLFMLGAAEKWNQGELSGRAFFATCFAGVMAILIRAAISKAEMASNALNPDITHVKAVEQTKTGAAGVVSGLFSVLSIFAVFLFMLSIPLLMAGCDTTAKAGQTPPPPLMTGKLCLGGLCIGSQTTDTVPLAATMPPPPPPPIPPTIANIERARAGGTQILPTIEK